MRKRNIAAAITLVLVAGVVAYQAATHVEPEPYVQLHYPRPEGPRSRIECRNGVAYGIYTTNRGEDLPAVRMDEPCSAFEPRLSGSD